MCAIAVAGCTTKGSDISVMSFNIRLSVNDTMDGDNNWIYRKEAVVKMINDVSPDLFGIQEGVYHQVCYMDDNLPQYGRYGVGRDDGLNDGEANAVFYKLERFDLVEKGTFWLSATPDTVSRGWDGACNRVVTWVRLKDKMAGGKDLLYFNTHFDHIGKVAREESGKLIVAKMKELSSDKNTPVFLTGDFNANYNDPILIPIREIMGMAREVAPLSDTLNTFNNWGKVDLNGGNEIIDHIFYYNAKPLKYETIIKDWGVNYISDHYPIIANFEY